MAQIEDRNILKERDKTMAEKQFLTKKGYEERVQLLEHLKVVRRKEVAQKLKEAREQGDLSENAEYDEDIEYTIVGSSEADSLNNKISNESPLGAALIGKKVGETIKVEAPIGEIEYKIVNVVND